MFQTIGGIQNFTKNVYCILMHTLNFVILFDIFTMDMLTRFAKYTMLNIHDFVIRK